MQFEMQTVLREREDLVESLGIREQTINQLRLENQQLMSRIMDIEARADVNRMYNVENSSLANVEVANLRAKNGFLEDRCSQLDEQVRSYEQKLYSSEKAQKTILREAKQHE